MTTTALGTLQKLSKEELLEKLSRLEDWVDSWGCYFLEGDMSNEFKEAFPELSGSLP